MTPDIRRKLAAEIKRGITTEVQVVYVLTGIRKLIERDEAEDDYPVLRFHCDWALHPRMDRASARAMLKLFDDAVLALKKKAGLPADVRRNLDRIAQMKAFKAELERFLDRYELPQLTDRREDGWVYFLYLYSKVVEDIPLFASAKAREKKPAKSVGRIVHIADVTVHLDEGQETLKAGGVEEFLYRMRWTIRDKDGNIGEYFVINGFTVRETEDAV
jgi:hypothetical protein